MSKLLIRIKKLEKRVSVVENKFRTKLGRPKSEAGTLRIDQAITWLTAKMIQHRGTVFSCIILDEAEEEGYSVQLVRVAKRRLGILHKSKGPEGWVWYTR